MGTPVTIEIKYIEATLGKSLSAGEKVTMTGIVNAKGNTMEFTYEKEAGEYGGSSVSFAGGGFDDEDELIDYLHDGVVDYCAAIIYDAIGCAASVFDDVIASKHSTYTEVWDD